MAIFSAFTVIRGISLLHLTAAYLLLTNPRDVAEQNIIVILGEAMQIPHVTTLINPSPLSAFSAIILSFLALNDLIATSLPTRSSLEYWTSIVPLRLIALFALTAYIYISTHYFPPSSSSQSLHHADPVAALKNLRGVAGVGATGFAVGVENLKNSLVFGSCFLEVMSWFWVFNLLREERSRFVMEEAIRENERIERETEQKIFGR